MFVYQRVNSTKSIWVLSEKYLVFPTKVPVVHQHGTAFSPQTSPSGWWYTYPSEKYDFVSWDDEIPNIWTVIKFIKNPWFQTTNQAIL